MSNIEGNDDDNAKLIVKTIRDDVNHSKALVIPKEFVKALGIENSRVSMSLLEDFDGNKHLVITKFLEIAID